MTTHTAAITNTDSDVQFCANIIATRDLGEAMQIRDSYARTAARMVLDPSADSDVRDSLLRRFQLADAVVDNWRV
jgi:hypothetical protein